MRLAGPSAPMAIRVSIDSPFASIRQPPSCREIPVTRADVRRSAPSSTAPSTIQRSKAGRSIAYPGSRVMYNQFPFGATHFAPDTRWATHPPGGGRPSAASPTSLPPPAPWPGPPPTFFLWGTAVRNPAAASCRAAMPPEGPAPTTTASNTSCKESEADISALRRGLGRESPREVFPVRGRPIHVRRDTSAKGRSALFRDELDRGQDPEAVHGRVFGEAHLLHDLGRARVGVVPQEVEDRDLLWVEDLRDRALLRAGLELHPLVEPLPLLRRRDDDLEERLLLDLEEVLRDGRRRDPHPVGQLRDLRVPVAVHLVLDDDRQDLALTFREESRPVGRVHPAGQRPGPVLSVFVGRRSWAFVRQDPRTEPRRDAGVRHRSLHRLQGYNRRPVFPIFGWRNARRAHRREEDRGRGSRGTEAAPRRPREGWDRAGPRRDHRRRGSGLEALREDEVQSFRGNGPRALDRGAARKGPRASLARGGRPLERGPQGPWDPRPAAAASADPSRRRRLGGRSAEGRGLLPPDERGARPDRPAPFRPGDAGGGPGTSPPPRGPFRPPGRGPWWAPPPHRGNSR